MKTLAEQAEDALLEGDRTTARRLAEAALRDAPGLGAQCVLAATSPPRRAALLLAQLQRQAPHDPRVLMAASRVAVLRGDAQGALQAAVEACARSRSAVARMHLAGLLDRLGQQDAALGAWVDATQAAPEDPRTWRGAADATEDIHHAQRLLTRGCAACPEAADLHAALGRVLLQQREWQAARAPLETAVTLDPSDSVTWHNLGLALRKTGAAEESLCAAKQAHQLDPDNQGVRLGLANALVAVGDPESASAALGDAVDSAACVLRAHICLAQGHLDDARRWCDDALAQDPREAVTWRMRARTQSLLADQQADLEKALSCRPDFGPALADLVHLRRRLCDWDKLGELQGRLDTANAEALRTGERAPESPFNHMCRSADDRTTLALAASWAAPPAPRPLLPPVQGPLRVGYLTADLRPHAMAWLLEGLFAAHDRERVHVTLFALGDRHPGPEASSLRSGADHVVELGRVSDHEASRRIRAEDLHVLVDLMGHTQGHRLGVLARRPAPIQASWLGYPGSTGSTAVDYLLLDGILAPPGEVSWTTESTERLPCYQANGPLCPVPAAPSRADLGLPVAGPVFGSFNRPEKLDQETFSAWMQILERVPTACLWLFARHPATQTNLRQHASRLGVDPDRLVFAGPVSHDAHLCRLQQVTLGLDSFVYGAHTTASDLLRVGVPLVSRRGPNTASRVASSLLHRCGVADTLVADSTSAYVKRAVHLATHPAALEAVRGRLLNNRAPLYDPAGMAHSLESLFEQWVQRAAVPTPSDPSSVP